MANIHDRKRLVEQKSIIPPGSLYVGLTFIDGRILFKHHKKWAYAFYGICHYGKKIAILTPSDYFYPAMITSIHVHPASKFCSIEHLCLNFDCPMNKFDKDAYVGQFKDMGAFSLALPLGLGSKPLWFNDDRDKYAHMWEDMILPVAGGIKWFDDKEKEIGD